MCITVGFHVYHYSISCILITVVYQVYRSILLYINMGFHVYITVLSCILLWVFMYITVFSIISLGFHVADSFPI